MGKCKQGRFDHFFGSNPPSSCFSVFVHRYRDADAGIRADCVREMGIWLKRHPAHFLEGNYLRYVGWVLSDIVCIAFPSAFSITGYSPNQVTLIIR